MKIKRISLAPDFFSFLLLFSSLSVFAWIDEIKLSNFEIAEIANNSDKETVYICLDEKLSNIRRVVSAISDLDDDPQSPINLLRDHIEQGFVIARKDAVLSSLLYAENVLAQNKDLTEEKEELVESLDAIISQIAEDKITIDNDAVVKRRSCHHLPVLDINERISVAGKSAFQCDVSMGEDLTVKGKAKFKDDVKFKGDVTIKGTLSVEDFVVSSCIENLCVENLSVVDGVVT